MRHWTGYSISIRLAICNTGFLTCRSEVRFTLGVLIETLLARLNRHKTCYFHIQENFILPSGFYPLGVMNLAVVSLVLQR